MTHRNRGIALIFTFDRDNYSRKRMYNRGMRVDADRLSESFTKLGFDVHRYSSLTKSNFEEILEAYSQRDYTNDDCLVCVVDGYGNEKEEVKCADNVRFDTRKIAERFMEIPSLEGKPKVIILGMARGHKIALKMRSIEGDHSLSSSDQEKGEEEEEEKVVQKTEYRKQTGEIFIFCSTFYSYTTWFSLNGSLPFQTLCDQLDSYGTKLKLTDIFLKVNQICTQNTTDNYATICPTTHHATKHLVFYKKN